MVRSRLVNSDMSTFLFTELVSLMLVTTPRTSTGAYVNRCVCVCVCARVCACLSSVSELAWMSMFVNVHVRPCAYVHVCVQVNMCECNSSGRSLDGVRPN